MSESIQNLSYAAYSAFVSATVNDPQTFEEFTAPSNEETFKIWAAVAYAVKCRLGYGSETMQCSEQAA